MYNLYKDRLCRQEGKTLVGLLYHLPWPYLGDLALWLDPDLQRMEHMKVNVLDSTGSPVLGDTPL